jgi:hypothetical protein
MTSDQPNLDAEASSAHAMDSALASATNHFASGIGHTQAQLTLFSTRQYLRLLILRGRIQDGDVGDSDLGCAARAPLGCRLATMQPGSHGPIACSRMPVVTARIDGWPSPSWVLT